MGTFSNIRNLIFQVDVQSYAVASLRNRGGGFLVSRHWLMVHVIVKDDIYSLVKVCVSDDRFLLSQFTE